MIQVSDLKTLAEPADSDNLDEMPSYTSLASPLRGVKRFLGTSSFLKGFAMVFGLWAGQNRFRSAFAIIFLLPDVYNLVQSVAYGFICPSLNRSLQYSWFCGNETRNFSSKDVIEVAVQFHFNKKDLLDFVLKLAQLLSHLTFLWSIWVICKKDGVIHRGQHSGVKPPQWYIINITILVFFFAMLSSTLWLILDNLDGTYPFLVSSAIYPIPLWASLLTCWIFSTYTSSLETMTSQVSYDITESTDIDDIINIHQQMCKTIFVTSDAFRVWFSIHWALYTVLSVVWVANVVFYYSILSQNASTFFSGTVYLCIYLYVFIYPCYCAASLTAKCQTMLTSFNMKYKHEWHDTHPFRQRQQLHLFLRYASYADCGYKVGNVTFGSMSVFFSTLLAIIGVGLRIFN